MSTPNTRRPLSGSGDLEPPESAPTMASVEASAETVLPTRRGGTKSSPHGRPAEPIQPAEAETVAPEGAFTMTEPTPFDTLEGQIVAVRYKVLRKIGEGGMGAVYLAEHVTIEKKVALKVLLHEYARKQVIKDRFLQEARAAAKIGHENIVDIIDFGQTPDGTLFFAMEYLEGRDLAHEITMKGPLGWKRTKTIMLQICRALQAAHDKGIIHRDLKPENIFLEDRNGQQDFVKILDFGIAKMSLEDDGGPKLTRTGMIFGTPQYMSPEQAQGRRPDNRVDIYAAGCIMYEALTGQVPFPGDSFMAILARHISEIPRPLSEVNPTLDLPRGVERIVQKAMAKKPEHRFQSMAEMAVAISRISDMNAPEAVADDKGSLPSLPPEYGEHDPAAASAPAQPTGEPADSMETLVMPGRRSGKQGIGLALVGLALGIAALVVVLLTRAGDSPTSQTIAPPVSPRPDVQAIVRPAGPPPTPPATASSVPDAGPVADGTAPRAISGAEPEEKTSESGERKVGSRRRPVRRNEPGSKRTEETDKPSGKTESPSELIDPFR